MMKALPGKMMHFCDELQKLVEAMDRINKSRKPEDLHPWMGDLPEDLREAMKNDDRPVLPKEKRNPMQMIGRFCNMFTLSYARRELWDLLVIQFNSIHLVRMKA